MRYLNKLRKKVARGKTQIEQLTVKQYLLAFTPEEAFKDLDLLDARDIAALLKDILRLGEDLLPSRVAHLSKRTLAARKRAYKQAVALLHELCEVTVELVSIYWEEKELKSHQKMLIEALNGGRIGEKAIGSSSLDATVSCGGMPPRLPIKAIGQEI